MTQEREIKRIRRVSWDNVRALKVVIIFFEVIQGLKVIFHKSMLVGGQCSRLLVHEATIVINWKTGYLPFYI